MSTKSSLALCLCLLWAVTSSCQKKKNPKLQQARDPSVIEQPTVVNPEQELSLKADALAAIQAAVTQALQSEASPALLADPSALAATAEILADAFQKKILASAQEPGLCGADAFHDGGATWLSCLLTTVVQQDFAELDQVSQRLAKYTSSRKKEPIAAALLLEIHGLMHKTSVHEKMLAQLSQQQGQWTQLMALLRDGKALSELPWLGESFYAKQKFVLTNSFQQGSVGSFRAFNFDSLVVYFEVKGDRFFMLRAGEGAYDGSNQQTMIISSYPITAKRRVGTQEFVQVDFSRPENKRFLLPSLFGYDAGADLDLSAESIYLTIAHQPKPLLKELDSGLYFLESDKNLVLDQLVLVNGTASLDSDDPFANAGALTPSYLLQKESLRPTLRFVQGLMKIGEEERAFAETQAKDLSTANQDLFAKGIEDRSGSSDIPYFPSGMQLLAGSRGDGSESHANAKKMNIRKPIIFVISANTPPVAIPVLKSAVLTYRELFEKMRREQDPPVDIRVYSQSEWEATAEGQAIGGTAIAADPRVNMILWEDIAGFNSAWGTSAINPESGESISGDILMPGVLWAKAGCVEWMIRNWASKVKPGEVVTPFPHPVSYALYDLSCNMRLLGMKLSGPASRPEASRLADEIEQANTRGESAKLWQIYRQSFPQAQQSGEISKSLITRQSGESDSDVALRIAANDEQWLSELSKKVRPAFGEDLDSQSWQKPKQSLAQSKVLDERKPKLLGFQAGRNHILVKPFCSKQANAAQAAMALANAGVPAVDTSLVKDPKEAALAMLRIVTVHELGHIFGLKHNFMASTTPSQLASDAVLPFAVAQRTDSIMDYNDAGIELEMGALADYSQAESENLRGSFGIYDVLALANLYDLASDGIKFEKPSAFCSDSNQDVFANCLPFDFGKDGLEHMIYQLNLAFQELRGVKDSDLSNPFVLQDLNLRLNGLASIIRGDLAQLLRYFGVASVLASNTGVREDQALWLEVIDKIYYAQGLKAEFFAPEAFLAKTGSPAMGIQDFLLMSPAKVLIDEQKQAGMAAITASNMRKFTDLELLNAIDDIYEFAANEKEEARYIKEFPNVRDLKAQQSERYFFRKFLVQHYSGKAIRPAGVTSLDWSYLEGVERKSGRLTKGADGKPVAVALDHAFLNSTANIAAKSQVKIMDAEGNEKEVLALVQGENTLNEMLIGVLALAKLGPWGGPGGGSMAFERLMLDEQTLSELLKNNLISERAKDQAKFLLSSYAWTRANGFSPFP